MQQRKGADGEKKRRNRELSEERNLTGTGRKEVEVWEVDQHWELIGGNYGEVIARKATKDLWKTASGWRKHPDIHPSFISR